MFHINKQRLSNGLRIVHNEDTSTQMVAINMLYGVGSRNEQPSHTGLAHLMEHLMFGGSANVQDFDHHIQDAGGECNAWTNPDMTNYYMTLPYSNAEIGFWMESDRLAQLALDQGKLQVQRSVVMEEFKESYLNRPYGDVDALMRNLHFKAHPYRWSTIGLELSHIEKTTLDDVSRFYHTYYTPSNAILAVTGHINWQETLRLAEKWFGDLPCLAAPKCQWPDEPMPDGIRRLCVERHVPHDRLYLTFGMCARTGPDYYAYDMISDLLGNGESSRLEQELVERKKLASQADAFIDGSLDAGRLHITVTPLPGIKLQQVEEAIWELLDELKQTDANETELQKVRNKFAANWIFSNMSYLNVATNLAYFELLGDAGLINQETSRYAAVTSAQIRQVAQTAFTPQNCATMWYQAKEPPRR